MGVVLPHPAWARLRNAVYSPRHRILAAIDGAAVDAVQPLSVL